MIRRGCFFNWCESIWRRTISFCSFSDLWINFWKKRWFLQCKWRKNLGNWCFCYYLRFKSRRRNFWVYNWWVISCLNLNLRGSTGRFMWCWYRNWLYRRRHRLWCLWWLRYWKWILRWRLWYRILCLGRRYRTFVWDIYWTLLWLWYRCCLIYRLWCLWW